MQCLNLSTRSLSHCYGAASDRPIGDPDVAHLPYDSQKCPKRQTSVNSDQQSIKA